jgi:GlpG protein
MSGVVYGLFGYFWLRGRLDPSFGVNLQRSTVVILVGWMILGFVARDVMRMANWAHLGGLVVGMAWGALAALRARRSR